MRRTAHLIALLGMAALLSTGCNGLEGLMALPKEMAATPETATAPPKSIPTEALEATTPKYPEPPPPRSELDRLPKIEPVSNSHGQDAGVIYYSAASLPQIIIFYKEMMKQQGWTSTDTLTDKANYANLNFNKNKELLIVSLGRDSSASPPRVMVSLTPHGALKAKDLPRYPGSKTLAEFDHTAIYVTADSVKKVQERTAALLKEAGWQERRAPAGHADNVSFEMKKGEMLLNVYIVVAPAQGNETTIQYSLRKKDL
jgi:hypothetical protein